jgi:hypothetical protein
VFAVSNKYFLSYCVLFFVFLSEALGKDAKEIENERKKERERGEDR